MLHPQKAGVAPPLVAARARRQLKALARPSGEFDASRYFRCAGDLGFHNVGMPRLRTVAREIARAHRDSWTVEDAMRFADLLLPDRFLETKLLGIEVVARFRRHFGPALLKRWKGWLAKDYSNNWATTDAICGMLIAPLLKRQPHLIADVAAWVSHRNMWVRRAAAVSLVGFARRGEALDVAYEVAGRLHHDQADLIQKAVGWLLREAGKTDMTRLECYLRQQGPAIPRTSIRYALEKFPIEKRQQLLTATRVPARS